MKKLLSGIFLLVIASGYSQTLFVPSGTSGIGASANGQIGVGTSTPSNIQGWDKVLNVDGSGHSKILASNGLNYRVGLYSHNSWAGGGGFVGTESNHKLHFITNYDPKITLDVNGNFGIATTTPSALLHINSMLDARKTFRIYWNNDLSKYLNIWQGTGGCVIDPIGTGLLYLGYDQPTNVIMGITGSGVNSGNVGIGTTTPDAKLAVNGQVHATEVKVTIAVPGPDYVFDKDYKLTPLEDIKNYIDQNKHLPEVPSAKEMEVNGIQLGEMNMLLLKKIEELTLYVIELKREITDLKK